MEPGGDLGAGGWVLSLPCTEGEVSQKEGVVSGGWIPHLLDGAAVDEENSNSNAVHYDKIICQLKSKLENAEPNEVEEYVKSNEGTTTLFRWKLMSNLCKNVASEQVVGATVRVSSCPERGDNLLDGTDSEWWTQEDTAWIELDLGRPVTVSKLKIKWWGTSVSRDYTVLASGQDGVLREVANNRVELESPEGLNSWSKLRGWDLETFRIRIELRNGCLDPWGMGMKFGIRNIIVEENTGNSLLPHPWILSEPHILELLLTSGYVQDHKWLEAVDLLAKILDLDPEARKGGYRLNLAVAIALTFSSQVKSFASYNKATIDPLERYQNFVCWAEQGVLFPIHASLSVWHLRYVVASWATDDELEWARENVPDEFKTTAKIGEATHKMVAYKEHNTSGVSIHEGAKFYDYQPQTLARMAELGAVCGGISKFGVAMAQAFGIPATPVAQPGHCAFLWWKEGQWTISNDVGGLAKATNHDGIQWSWNENSTYIMLMEKAQQDRESLVFSEKLRWASKFVKQSTSKFKLLDLATGICPANFPVWRDLASVCRENSTESDAFKSWLDQEAGKMNGVTDISSRATVTVSDCPERGQNVVDGTGSEWWSGKETAWVELDLGRDCLVTEMRIQWWGISVSKDYTVLAAGGDCGFQKVCDTAEELESPEGFNSWSRLQGWTQETKRIRIELKDGQMDPWNMGKLFGIRNIVVEGREVNPPTTLTAWLEEKAHKCLNDHKVVEADVCKLLFAPN